MSKQYGYRFYDSAGNVGPLPRDEVLAKLRDDLAAIPIERDPLGEDRWSLWRESNEPMTEVCIASVPAEEPTA